jgi:hypothetical protein
VKEARSKTDEYGAAIAPEIAMWIGVVLQAISDSRLTPFNKNLMYVQHEARRWLAVPSRDLCIVLDYAGIDYSWWHNAVVGELQRQWARLDALHTAGEVGLRPSSRTWIEQVCGAAVLKETV